MKALGERHALPSFDSWGPDKGTYVVVEGLHRDFSVNDLYNMFACFGAIVPRGAHIQKKGDEVIGLVNFVNVVDAGMARAALDFQDTPWTTVDGNNRLKVSLNALQARSEH